MYVYIDVVNEMLNDSTTLETNMLIMFSVNLYILLPMIYLFIYKLCAIVRDIVCLRT